MGDPAWRAVAEAAASLHGQRERWLNPPEWIGPLERRVDGSDDFSDVPPEARALIRRSAIQAAAARDPRLKKRTLTNLYNQRPTWLVLAHTALDRAVLAAYAAADPGGPWDPGLAEGLNGEGSGVEGVVLEGLLRLNQERG